MTAFVSISPSEIQILPMGVEIENETDQQHSIAWMAHLV